MEPLACWADPATRSLSIPMELVPLAVVPLPADIKRVTTGLVRPNAKYHIAAPARASSMTNQSQPIPPPVVAGAPELGAVVWAIAGTVAKSSEPTSTLKEVWRIGVILWGCTRESAAVTMPHTG